METKDFPYIGGISQLVELPHQCTLVASPSVAYIIDQSGETLLLDDDETESYMLSPRFATTHSQNGLTNLGNDGIIRRWNLNGQLTGRYPVGNLQPTSGVKVNSLVINTELLISSHSNGMVQIMNSKGKLQYQIRPFTKSRINKQDAYNLLNINQEEVVITGAKGLSFHNLKIQKSHTIEGDSCYFAALHPSGNIVTASESTVHFWSTKKREKLYEFEVKDTQSKLGHQKEVTALTVDQEGNIFTADEQGEIHKWGQEGQWKGRLLGDFVSGQNKEIYSLQMTSVGNLVAGLRNQIQNWQKNLSPMDNCEIVSFDEERNKRQSIE